MHESFLSHQNYRFLKWASLLCVAALASYLSHSPAEPPNGGTWLGYTLGGMGASIILFLLWYGIRKRQYHMTGNKQSAWVSAHVYLGGALVVIVSLHCGFQFGWNVHTLAYVLMMLVVISGGFGLYAYLMFPAAISRIRNGETRPSILKAIAAFDEQCLAKASEIGGPIHSVILLIVERTVIGGSVWQQLTGKSLVFPSFARLWRSKTKIGPVHNGMGLARAALIDYVVESDNGEKIAKAGELLGLLTRRQDLIERLRQDVKYHAWMKGWLYLHVPLSVALLAALTIHVVVVFFYW